jgi:hypothetical protein
LNPPKSPIVKLAERYPRHLVEVILHQNRQRLAEQRSPDRQDVAAKEYVRARTFLQRFRWGLIMFMTSLAFGILQAILPYMVKGTMAWFEAAALGANSTVGVVVMIVALGRKRKAERLVEQANRAADARKLAVLSRT